MLCVRNIDDSFSDSQEYNKHDKEPSKYFKQWRGIKPKTGAPYSCDIGYERFLGPEVGCFLSRELFIFQNGTLGILPILITEVSVV